MNIFNLRINIFEKYFTTEYEIRIALIKRGFMNDLITKWDFIFINAKIYR